MAVKTFGARVLYLRKMWGLTQSDIHKAGGPSRTTLYRIERGESSPKELSDTSLRGLADALKCHRAWLETGVGTVFLKGVTPPEGALQELQGQAPEPEEQQPIYPEVGRYMTDGPTDWAIVVAAVNAVEESIGQWEGWQKADINVYRAEAYRLVYKHLAKNKSKDPFHPIPYQILDAILGTV